MNFYEIAVARERGRLMAAFKVATDPEARRRIEEAVGVEMARRVYPEAYAAGSDEIFEPVRAACLSLESR